jgi:hypothetical protein
MFRHNCPSSGAQVGHTGQLLLPRELSRFILCCSHVRVLFYGFVRFSLIRVCVAVFIMFVFSVRCTLLCGRPLHFALLFFFSPSFHTIGIQNCHYVQHFFLVSSRFHLFAIIIIIINIIIIIIMTASWSTGQSSWLQIQRLGFGSRHYQKKK